jgi:glycosyltransferase involved in cell wall biosynthesis
MRELVLIGNFPPDRQESMQRFAHVMTTGMASRGWTIETWAPQSRFAKLAGTYRYTGLPKYLGYLDKFYVFPREIRRRVRRRPRDTVYHIVDHGNAVYAEHLRGRHLVVTCHDLLQIRSALGEFPQNRVSPSGQKYQRWILKHLSRVPLAVCVSEKTRTDLRRLTDLSEDATPVIHMGLNYPYRPTPRPQAETLFRAASARAGASAASTEETLRAGFFVGVGGAQWYKNRTGLASIFAALAAHTDVPKRLVFIGPEFDPEQTALLQRSGAADRVLRLSGVSNEELQAVYSLAAALIFPSWEEGFGWPIAEAQACGCPVFTSNRAPMTEVGGPAARYFDPAEPAGAAATIARELPKRAELVEQSIAWAARWDTDKMLAAYEREYLRLTGQPANLAAVGP